MNYRKITSLVLILATVFNTTIYASDTTDDRYTPKSTLQQSVKKAVNDYSNFNGSVMISKNNDENYEVLYEGAVGSNGGYDIDTVYDIGSVSKLFTTVAIMQLEEDGKLNYNDTIDMYFDNVPSKKQDVTIKQLLTHSSGIYASENDDHDVSKDDEIARIMKSRQLFTPGTNYKYSNAGFTLLAAIVEEASGESFEDYMRENLFEPLELDNTGFPTSDNMSGEKAVSGSLNGVDYGNVTEFDFGWYSKGYTDVLSTPRDLTYFFNSLISGEIIGAANLALMSNDEIDIGSDAYRGYGTDIKHIDSDQKIIGHTGIWYGGNTAIYYRPSDKILFVIACDELTLNNDLPANYVFNTLNAMYPSGKLNKIESVETVKLEGMATLSDLFLPTFNHKVNADGKTSNNYVDQVDYIDEMKSDLHGLTSYVKENKYEIGLIVCMTLLGMTSYYLYYRLKDRKKRKKNNKKKRK